MSSERLTITFVLNGQAQALEVEANTVLADLLRQEFGLIGVKIACEQAVCGSCTCLVDGKPVASCAKFAFEVDGREVTTIEGLAKPDGTLDPVQEAFIACGAFQCGYCTPGMILLTKALLDHHPQPDRETITDWTSSNICRCTGYTMIISAVELAAKKSAEAEQKA